MKRVSYRGTLMEISKTDEGCKIKSIGGCFRGFSANGESWIYTNCDSSDKNKRESALLMARSLVFYKWDAHLSTF